MGNKRKRVDAMDRISELPPSIIHQIMSYLAPQQLAQTSILSKTWNRFHASYPILDFLPYFPPHRGRFGESYSQSIEKFMKFVDVSLLRFCQLNLSIEKFRLLVDLLDVDKSSSLVDEWIRLVVENGVKELDLRVKRGGLSYTCPQTIFSAQLLTNLRLVGCNLVVPSDVIRFNSLKKLILDRVTVNGQTVKKLVSGCPLLEDLSVMDCYDLECLCVSDAPKLKRVLIMLSKEVGMLQIVAPSLQNFSLVIWERKLVTPEVIDLAGCLHLKKLVLHFISITDQKFHQFISQFAFLEDLSVYNCDLLERVTISSNQLKKLKLHRCYDLKALDIDTPNLVEDLSVEFCQHLERVRISSNQLKKLKVIGCYLDLNALDVDTPNLLSFAYKDNRLPTIWKINAPCTWEVGLIDSEFNNVWFLKLREFLGAANKIENLDLVVTGEQASSNLDEFKEICRLLPCHVEYLRVHIGDEVPESEYKNLLDVLLRICYPKTFSVRSDYVQTKHKLFKVLYNEMKNNRDVNCCNHSHIKCWRHYLKDVEILCIVGNKDDNFFDSRWPNLTESWPVLTGGPKFQLDWGY